MAELKLKVSADSSKAVTAFEKVDRAAGKTKKELRALAGGSAARNPLAAQFSKASTEVQKYSRKLDEAARKTKNLQGSTSKWRASLGRGLKVGVGMAVGGVVAGGYASINALRAAAERDAVTRRLGGTIGDTGAAETISRQLANWSTKNGGRDVNELLGHVGRLVQAGLSATDATEAVKNAVIATAGDAAKLQPLIEGLAESVAGGALKEDFLNNMAKLGVDIRSAMAEQLNMDRDQLKSAIAAHAVTGDAAIRALASLTSEGSKLRDAHKAALDGIAGDLARMQAELKETQIAFGAGIAKGAASYSDWTKHTYDFDTEAMAARVGEALGAIGATLLNGLMLIVNKLVEAVDWVMQKLGFKGLPKDWDKNKASESRAWTPYSSARTREAETTRLRRKAANSVAEERFAAAEKAAAADAAKKMEILRNQPSAQLSLAARRTAIGAKTGLGDGVSSAALAAKIDGLGLRRLLRDQARVDAYNAHLSDLARFGLTENSTAADYEHAAEQNFEHMDRIGELRYKTDDFILRAGLDENSTLAAAGARFRAAVDGNAESLTEAARLVSLQKELAAIEKEEAAVAKIKADYERRMEIQRAILSGDRERADLLERQAEAEKLATEYAAAGVDLDTARRMAAEEVAAKHATPADSSPFDPTSHNVRLKETISSPLAHIGGGGVRIRLYENQQLRAAESTASATASIADMTQQILTHLTTTASTGAAVLA